MHKENYLLENLGIKEKKDLYKTLDEMAPSMAEYYIENSLGDKSYVRTSYIESNFTIGRFTIIIDYSDNIFIDEKISDSTLETETMGF